MRQNAADGGNREQAFGYQTFVLDFLLIAGLAARARGEDFSPLYWRRLEVMIDFLASMTDVAGTLPMIGDADEGYVVRLAAEPGFSPHDSLIATGAVLFDRPGPRRQGRRDRQQDRHLVRRGRGAPARRDCSERGRAGFRPRQQFSESGYYLLGSAFETPDEVRLLVDAGPLGYLSLAAHGHADALSFTLSIGDREILVDPGTYAYHTRSGLAALLPQHAGAQHRDHRRRRTSRCRPAISCGPTTRARAASSSKSGPAASASSASITATSDSKIRWCTGARSTFEPARQLIEVDDLLRCDGRASRAARLAFRRGLPGRAPRRGTARDLRASRRCHIEPLEELERVEIHRGGTPDAGRLDFALASAARNPRPRCYGIRESTATTVLRTRITYTRSRTGVL